MGATKGRDWANRLGDESAGGEGGGWLVGVEEIVGEAGGVVGIIGGIGTRGDIRDPAASHGI